MVYLHRHGHGDGVEDEELVPVPLDDAHIVSELDTVLLEIDGLVFISSHVFDVLPPTEDDE